jgi:hypothetical protein
MPKPVKVEKEAFERVLQKMIHTKPAPRAGLPRSKKKLARTIGRPTVRMGASAE